MPCREVPHCSIPAPVWPQNKTLRGTSTDLHQSIFSLQRCTIQTIRPVVSRKKRSFSAHFWPGGAVPPPRVSPFSKLKRSKGQTLHLPRTATSANTPRPAGEASVSRKNSLCNLCHPCGQDTCAALRHLRERQSSRRTPPPALISKVPASKRHPRRAAGAHNCYRGSRLSPRTAIFSDCGIDIFKTMPPPAMLPNKDNGFGLLQNSLPEISMRLRPFTSGKAP